MVVQNNVLAKALAVDLTIGCADLPYLRRYLPSTAGAHVMSFRALPRKPVIENIETWCTLEQLSNRHASLVRARRLFRKRQAP